MKRTPLKRGTPLQAKRWGIKPRRPRRLSGPHADPARMGFVAGLCCVLAIEWPFNWMPAHAGFPWPECSGRTHVCHEGKTPGTSLRCPDSETMPMCERHHLNEWGGARGFFRGWTKEQRREWADARIAETTALYLSHGSRRG